MTSRNRVMQTCTPWTVVCRSSLMSLIMTFMFEPAKLQMNWARASGTSIRCSDEPETCKEAAPVMTPARRRAGYQSRDCLRPASVPYPTRDPLTFSLPVLQVPDRPAGRLTVMRATSPQSGRCQQPCEDQSQPVSIAGPTSIFAHIGMEVGEYLDARTRRAGHVPPCLGESE